MFLSKSYGIRAPKNDKKKKHEKSESAKKEKMETGPSTSFKKKFGVM